jgi:amino acid adenylation domain-containing protein
MTRILLMVVGTDGDFRPMARIGVALKAQGHDVTMIANCYFEERARQAGLRFAAFDTPEEYERFIAEGASTNSPQGALASIQRHILPKIRTQYDLIKAHCRSRDTLLMASNQYFIIAQIMAEKLGIPVVPVFLAPSFFAGLSILERVIGSMFADAINHGRAELGLPPVVDWHAWLMRNPRYILLWPEWYAEVTPGWSAAIAAGFVVPDVAQSELPQQVRSFLATGTAPILISGGTGRFVGADFYAVCVEACVRLGRRAILVTRHADLVPPQLPPGVVWFKELPFASVMPQVGAIMHHGGIGTICQALAAGIPQLVLPLGADRPDNAERLERIGVGRFLLRVHWQPAHVAEALGQLLDDPAVRHRCRATAQRMHETDALATVCAVIDELLASEAAESGATTVQPERSSVRAAEPDAGQSAALRQVDQLSQERLELLARLLKQKQSDAAKEPAIPRQPRTGDDLFPLSFAQQRLWFLEQWAPGSAAYHLPGTLTLHGPLDYPALVRSLHALVARHEILRTSLPLHAGQPVQRIAASAALPLPLLDLHALPAAARAALLPALAHACATRPFDLATGPLLRLYLLRLAPHDHRLLLCLHHLIADGESLARFLHELTALYHAHAGGQPAALPPLPIQYADFAVWQRQWVSGARRDQLLTYWTTQLAGAPHQLALPADYPPPQQPTFAGARVPLALDATTTAALLALAQPAGATLFMGVLAALVLLLARLSGQDDLLIGVPVAGRTQPALDGLIGCFVNTLVLRGRLVDNPPFATLLARVRQTCLDAYAHQELPFEQLVAALAPLRDPRVPPLVQVVLTWQRTPLPPLVAGGLTLTPQEGRSGVTKFDLTLDLVETADGVAGGLEYATERFAAATIQRLVRQFQTLLAGIVAAPQQRGDTLPLLSAAERQQALVEWNVAGRAAPRELGLSARLLTAAAATPDALAVVCAGQALSYGALYARARQLAQYLRQQGVGPEMRVGVCMARSVELLIGIVGILLAGGAYVPLDPDYPPARLAFMIGDAQLALLLTATPLPEPLRGAVTPGLARVVDLVAAWPQIVQARATRRPVASDPAQLAYVIYTSGSTGVPKGVMVTRGGLLTLCDGLRVCFADPAVQQVGLLTSISFDISINQIFPALLNGRTLHIIPEAVKYDRAALLRELWQQQLHVLDGVPSYVQLLLDTAVPERRLALRYLLLGGEPLPRRLLRRIWQQLGAQLVVVNIYGLTEASDVNAFSWLRANADAAATGAVAIGRPLGNNQVYVLNRQDGVQPVGVVGELGIAGASLARGYLGRPDLTAARFAPNPFVGDRATRPAAGGMRLCRTGDRGYWQADGTLVVLGRQDGQVKLRGYRIEVGEIEAVLGQHTAVRECVVLLRTDTPDADGLADATTAQLVAYVVPTDEGRRAKGEEADSSFVSELRAYAQSRLPAYMLPAAYVVLAALPRTANGKLDRQALPAPAAPAAARSVAPRTAVEAVLAQMWAQTLQVPQVGVTDSFFALGGHSLLAVQLIAQIRSTFQVKLSFRSLFDATTIAELASVIIAHEAKPGQSDRIARVLQRLDAMSVEETRMLLAQKEQETHAE